MTNKKSTKRALLLSALSLLMCVSMLIGSTFAWFTDSVTSGQNKIQSGNLDVELYYTYDAAVAEDVNSAAWVKVTSTTDVFGYNLWEPGYTKVAYFKVVNEGSLELKYQLAADVYEEKAGKNQAGAEFLLSDYIKTALVEAGATRDQILSMKGTPLKNSYDMSKGSLAANGTAVVGLAIWMPTTVDNVANHDGKTIPEITFGINLLATQKDAEKDSFGSDYDEEAWVEGMNVYNAADLIAALANEDKVILVNDIETTEVIKLKKDVAINLNGKTLSASLDVSDDVEIKIENGTLTNDNKDVSGIQVNKGNVTLTDVEITSTRHAIRVEGGEVVINDGIYKVSGSGQTQHAVNVSDGGKVTINGGTFIGPKGLNADSGSAVNVQSGSTVIINGGDFSNGLNNTLNGAGTLTVYGGTFDQNPASRVADGYKAVKNNGVYYIVTDDIDGVIATPADLVALGGTQITGEYALVKDLDMTGYEMKPIMLKSGAANELTFLGNGHTISNLTLVQDTQNGMSVAGMFNALYSGMAINVENLTIANATSTSAKYAAIVVAYNSTTMPINLTNVDVKNATVSAETVASLVSYTTSPVTLKDCDVSGLKLEGAFAENKVGALVGTANQASCVVNVDNCTNATAYNDAGRVINGATWSGVIGVNSLDALQKAVNETTGTTEIALRADIEGNVTVAQKPNVTVIIDGNDKTLKGTITVDGKSEAYSTAFVTIKNVKFVADTVATEACINMGVDGNNNTRYIANLTVKNCYFNVPGKVAVKSYDNGDKNLKIIDCTVAEGMHSLVQVNNVAGGLLVEGCKYYSKNGINIGQSESVTVRGCEADVLGYAVRFGANGGPGTVAETYIIDNCTLKSANNEDDATVILRSTADKATLTITNSTIVGTPDINNIANATIVK